VGRSETKPKHLIRYDARCARPPRFAYHELRKPRTILTASSQAPLRLLPAADDQDRKFARAFAIARDAIEQHAFPGAAIAVGHRGKLVASCGFGHFTYDDASPSVTRDTIFDIASVTKAVATTTAAMILFERGELKLEQPVFGVLPEFVSLSPVHQRPRRELVRIGMLLAHSSGLPAYERLFEFAKNRQELVRAALTTPLTNEPGSRAEYSDIGFIILGELLAQVAGEPLDQFAQREIFTPLGLQRTWFIPPLELRPHIPPTEDDRAFRKRIIQGEVHDENAWVMGGVSGHAGMFASAPELAQFAECILQGGAPLVKPATLALFTRRQDSPRGTSRALGWDTPSQPSSSGTGFSPSSFGHLGFTGTSLWIDPQRHLSVAFLTNRTWPDRATQAIREVRPRLHDAIVKAIESA
jgi:CubicO group peptidase (beta-lactamase class C family)